MTTACPEELAARLASGKPVRRTLPGNGRLHVDRLLPFLVAYRRPAERPDPGTDRLARGFASYLVADAGLPPDELAALIEAVATPASETFGAFLLVEVWSAPDREGDASEEDTCVHVVTPDQQMELEATQVLVEALGDIEIDAWTPEVSRMEGKLAAPPGMSALLDPDLANRLHVYVVGVELDPMWRDARGHLYPERLRRLAGGLATAVQKTVFRFSGEKTDSPPTVFLRFGRRSIVKAVRNVDEALGELCNGYDFLLGVTPVDAARAWRVFKESEFREMPTFRYRPLTTDPELLLRQLYSLPLEDIEDATLERIYREKVREVARELTMLSERNTHRFLPGSFQLYGEVEPELLDLALGILDSLPPSGPSADRHVGAEEFGRMAMAEFVRYGEQADDFDGEIELRSDISGLVVSKGTLLVDRSLSLTPVRARALLHHEVGTHIVSWFNGSAQPLQVFRTGLAGYDEFQEGIAVVSEYLVGGLTSGRLKLIAARVVAVDRMTGGASFLDIFHELVDSHGLAAHTAFTATMRVVRAGGLTKDAVYLRGFRDVVQYLRDGGDPLRLFIGKVAKLHLPVVDELLEREVLVAPRLRPTCLDDPDAGRRLGELRDGRPLSELFQEQ